MAITKGVRFSALVRSLLEGDWLHSIPNGDSTDANPDVMTLAVLVELTREAKRQSVEQKRFNLEALKLLRSINRRLSKPFPLTGRRRAKP